MCQASVTLVLKNEKFIVTSLEVSFWATIQIFHFSICHIVQLTLVVKSSNQLLQNLTYTHPNFDQTEFCISVSD